MNLFNVILCTYMLLVCFSEDEVGCGPAKLCSLHHIHMQAYDVQYFIFFTRVTWLTLLWWHASGIELTSQLSLLMAALCQR